MISIKKEAVGSIIYISAKKMMELIIRIKIKCTIANDILF
jgi:hypothetical protein